MKAKQITKRILAMFIALIMVMSLNGFTVLAESSYDGQDEIAMEEALVGEGGDVDTLSGEEPAPAASAAEEPSVEESTAEEPAAEEPAAEEPAAKSSAASEPEPAIDPGSSESSATADAGAEEHIIPTGDDEAPSSIPVETAEEISEEQYNEEQAALKESEAESTVDETIDGVDVDATADDENVEVKGEEAVDKTASAEEVINPELPEGYTFDQSEYVYEDDFVSVKATLTEPSAVPDQAKFVVTPVTSSTIVDGEHAYNYDAYMDTLNDTIDGEKYNEENTLLYDIGFLVPKVDKDCVETEGWAEYQPTKGSVHITLTFKDAQLRTIGAEKAENVEVLHLPLKSDVLSKYDTTATATAITADEIAVNAVVSTVMLSDEQETIELTSNGLSVFSFSSAVLANTEEELKAETEPSENQEFTYEQKQYVYEDAFVSVTATLTKADAVPDQAEFVVTPVTPESNTDESAPYNYDAYMEALNNDADGETYDETNTLLYDIAFIVTEINEEGEPYSYEFQPESGSVVVSVVFRDNQLSEGIGATTDESISVKHLPIVGAAAETDTTQGADITAEDIAVEEVEADICIDGQESADFVTDTFSVWAFSNNNVSMDITIPAPETATFATSEYNAHTGGEFEELAEFGLVAFDKLDLSSHTNSNFATKHLTGTAA